MPRPAPWILCPCRFDVPSFARLRAEALEALSVAGYGAPRFVLVDDSAGVDPAVQGLRRSGGLEVLTTPRNLGHQGALVFALRALSPALADEDLVVTMDADGEDRPADLPAILSALEDTPAAAAALAWRTRRKEPPLFQLCYFFFKILFRIATGKKIRSGNFAAFRGRFVRENLLHPHFDRCYASSFHALPLKLRFVPLPRGRRYLGKSKMSYASLFLHGLSMMAPFRDTILRRLATACATALALALLAEASQRAPLARTYAASASPLSARGEKSSVR